LRNYHKLNSLERICEINLELLLQELGLSAAVHGVLFIKTDRCAWGLCSLLA